MKKTKHLFTFLALMCCMFMISAVSAHADESSDITTYDINLPVEKTNVTYDIPVEPGRNYTVTVYYKAFDEVTKNMNIFYEEVTEDEITPNVKAADDRSGLLNEVLTPGEEGSRTFTFAAVDDTLNLIVAGNVTLVKVDVQLLPQNTAGEKRTVYLVGDSQLKENAPKTGWAQVINRYFTDDIIFVNKAIGARSTGSYIRQGRWNEVLLAVKPGDYVFVDFGHNDGGGVAGRAVTVSKYQKYLEEVYIEGVRQRGGIPVIVSIGNRNNINKSKGIVNPTLPNYVEAARTAAANKNAAFIDLNAESIVYLQNLYDSLGSAAVDLHYIDGTHYSEFGAVKMAAIVVNGICNLKLEGLYEHYVAPTVATKAPATATDVKLTRSSSVTVTWTASTDAEYYLLEKATIQNGTLAKDFVSLGASLTTTYTDNDVSDGNDYAYRIIAVNAAGASEVSAVSCTDSNFVYVDPALATPTPTASPVPTNTPAATATSVPTPVPSTQHDSPAFPISVMALILVAMGVVVVIAIIIITLVLAKERDK